MSKHSDELEQRDLVQELWLVYCELRELEARDLVDREERLRAVREHLGRIINGVYGEVLG